jgi:cobyrinic acid a,c-diamide synthase
MIAGTGSGVGKTTVTVALLRSLARRGLAVSAFKVGPDFLDPTYLAIASGRPCHNLDGWMMGTAYAAELFERASRGADLAVVEGVMGLYDGSSPTSAAGSAAEIARLLAAPVILVAGAHGMSRSFAAQVRGYVGFEAGVRIAGVLANSAGSPRHAAGLAESLRAAGLPPLVGAIPRGAFATLPSRHLGLVSADRVWLGEELLDGLADALEAHVDLDAVLALAHAAAPLAVEPRPAAAPRGAPLRLGVAFDEAFHFYYADTFASLEQAGFTLVRFSPLHAACLPEGLHGLYLGGGYPEAFAEALSANEPMRLSVREFAGSGRPVYAECGGLMYLSQWIAGADGGRREMCGVLPCGTRMLERRKALGYAEAELTEDALWGGAGTVARGHEFHYSELVGDPAASAGWRRVYRVGRSRGGEREREGFTNGTVLASYVHLHFAARPEMARRFHRCCAEVPGAGAAPLSPTSTIIQGGIARAGR